MTKLENTTEFQPTCPEALERCNEYAHKCAEANKNFKEFLEEETKSLTEARAKYIDLRRSLWRYRIKDKWESFWAAVMIIAAPKTDQGTSFAQKLKLFAKTMWAWARSGFKMSDEQTAQARLEQCKACPQLILPQQQCSMCGCMMEKKVTIKGASCPLKKW